MSNYAKDVAKEVHGITAKLIDIGLCSDSNYPRLSVHPGIHGAVNDISIPNIDETAVALKEQAYADTYNALREARAYNMLLVDGAMIQFRYRFLKEELLKHSLCFFPSPDLLEYQNAPDVYEMDLLYADVIAKDVVTTPIRFDFDIKSFVDYLHPASHFTIGQYKNCRIPVIGGVTPFRFMNFVLRAFYNTTFSDRCGDLRGNVADFGPTVSPREKADLHWTFAM
jgi:hypothetical protein